MARLFVKSGFSTPFNSPLGARCISLISSRILPFSGAKQVSGLRYSSHSPLGSSPQSRKKITIKSLQQMYKRKEPIAMITAHDFPSAHVADHAGMEIILVGDSLAMVALGMKDTSEVRLDDMILHCRSVARATESAFLV